MTLEQLIIKLKAFEKVVGGDQPIFLIQIDTNASSGMRIEEDISIGLGYEDKTDTVKCLFIGNQVTFDWLEDSVGTDH